METIRLVLLLGTSTSNSVTVTAKKSDGSSIVFYYDFSSNSWKQSGSTQLMVAPGDSINLAFARTTPFNNAYNGTTTYSTTAIVQSNFSASLNRCCFSFAASEAVSATKFPRPFTG